MSKPYRAWKGALELNIGGVPLPVNVAFYARAKKARNKSFRNLAPSGQPVVSKSYDPSTDEECEVQKGWDLGAGRFAVIDSETIEQISEGSKSKVLTPAQVVPLDSIALNLAIDRFAVRNDPDVAGSAPALNIVWNGLLKTGRAFVYQATLTGSHDGLVVLYATENGLWAALLPFEHELYPIPTPDEDLFVENEQAATLFEQALEQGYELKPEFEHSAFVSEYATRRERLIQAAIDGKPIVEAKPAAKDEPVVDLMAALTAAANKPKPKATKKAPTKKAKVTA
jgi:non-homologous end joining protein Ku